MSSTIPSEDECIELLMEAGCKRRVVIHCCTVEAVAKEIVSRVKGADPDLVAAALQSSAQIQHRGHHAVYRRREPVGGQ